MRSAIFCFMLITSAAINLGCSSSSSKPADGGGGVAGGGSNFGARYDAAHGISVASERDAALAKLSADAADAGDAETVKKCVREIAEKGLKDDTAYNSSIALGKAGKTEPAIEIAKLISANERRDDALSKLAKEDFPKETGSKDSAKN